jgi:hypothetical protein
MAYDFNYFVLKAIMNIKSKTDSGITNIRTSHAEIENLTNI